METQYLYILSHSTSPANIIKVGETKEDPHIRAKYLSKTVRGNHIVEWYMEVPDSKAAERLAHLLLENYREHKRKEYFTLEVEPAVAILKLRLIDHFKLEDAYCFEGPRLREIARRNATRKPDNVNPALKQKARLIVREQELEQEDRTVRSELANNPTADEILRLSGLDRLEQFVEEVYQRWSQSPSGLDGLTAKEIGDQGEQYMMKRLSQQGYDVVLTPYNRTPVDVFGLKWRGYFWHLALIQVKTAITDPVHQPTVKDYPAMREFGRFVKEQFLRSSLYQNYTDKPIAFSVGVASVRNHRPAVNRCTLVGAEFINWYWSNLPREKTNRIKALVEQTHALK